MGKSATQDRTLRLLPASRRLLRGASGDTKGFGNEACEASGVDCLLEREVRLAETAGHDGPQLDAVRLRSRDDLIALSERDLQRLLDQHVLARIQGGDRRIAMGTARRADGDDVHRVVTISQ